MRSFRTSDGGTRTPTKAKIDPEDRGDIEQFKQPFLQVPGSPLLVERLERRSSKSTLLTLSPQNSELHVHSSPTDMEKMPLVKSIKTDYNGLNRGLQSPSMIATPTAAASAARAHRHKLILSGCSYCLCSASLILLNKYALSSFAFACPTLLLCFHCGLAVLMVLATAALGYIEIEPLKKEIVYLWAPVNLLFVMMLVTSFYALQLLGVGMFTVLKNLTNFFTIGGDRLFFGKTYSYQVWACLFLMVVSAGLGGYTDLRFSPTGYSWQVFNCLITASYSLYLSGVMTKVTAHTRSGGRMSEFSMVYYNNLLSLPLLLLLAAAMGEFQALPYQAALRNPTFINVAVFGGVIGFGISFSSLWYLSNSTATIYSLTGSLNKILVAAAGIVIFQEATSAKNLASIGVGLLAALVFVLSKDMGKK